MSPPNAFGIRRLAVVAAATVLSTLAFAGPVQAETPPAPLAAPVDLTVEPAVPTRAESITASWAVPGGTPEDATVHWALCDDGDIAPVPGRPNGCGDRNQVSEDRITSITIPTPDEFAGNLWVWFEVAGEPQGPAARAAVVIDRTAPGAPTNVEWADDLVRWAAPPPAGMFISEDRVHWKLCRGWIGFAEDCVTGEGPAKPFALSGALRSPATPAPGYCLGQQWSLRLWLEDAAGNVDPSPGNVGGIGGAMSPMCVPIPEHGWPTPAPRTKTNLTVGHRAKATGKGAKRRQRVTITATAKPAEAGGTVRLQVTGKQGKHKLSRTRNVRLANGRASFTLTVPKGFRRLSVKATYAGSETHAPSSRTSTVRIPR